MERIYLLPKEGEFFKANLHAHSTHSDGALTPQKLKEIYKEKGYQVFAYTDHNVLNYFTELNDENFLVLCGYEVDAYTPKSYGGFQKCCHLNAIARNPKKAILVEKPDYDIGAINETIKILREHDFIVNYNHPAWSAEESCDYLPLEGLTAMEIYNHGCEIATNDGDNRSHYDIMLKHGKKLFCIATDDNHNCEYRDDVIGMEETDSFGGFTMIKADCLAYKNIINAIDNGDFYCSQGPAIKELYIDGDILTIECSPVKTLQVKSDGIGAEFYMASKTNSITHAEFDLSKISADRNYIRLEITDSQKLSAFSNPYYLK